MRVQHLETWSAYKVQQPATNLLTLFSNRVS